MSVLSWIKLTVCLWLLRQAVKLTGWLLLAAAAWALPVITVYVLAAALHAPGWPTVALTPGRDREHGWSQLTVPGVTRTFLLVAPVALPAGLVLAALIWAWRIYALTRQQRLRSGRGRYSRPFGTFRAGSGTAARSACSCGPWPPPQDLTSSPARTMSSARMVPGRAGWGNAWGRARPRTRRPSRLSAAAA